MSKISWRIHYRDSTTYDNTMGSPASAPSDGVVAIAMHDPTGLLNVIQMSGWDMYAWVDWDYDEHGNIVPINQWWGFDLQGYLARQKTVVVGPDGNLTRLPCNHLIEGGSVSNRTYSAIMDRLKNDPDFGKKSSRHPMENGAIMAKKRRP